MSNDNAVYGEIEIRLHEGRSENVEVQLSVSDPETQGEQAPARGRTRLSLADLALDLLQKEFEPQAYGEALADFIFSAEKIGAGKSVRDLYAETKPAFDARARLLRLRLTIDGSLSRLHGLRWELLCDPLTKQPLATTERMLFSRFMLSQDWRTVKLKPKTDLKALIAVAAPTDLEKYRMADVKKADELGRARAGLAGLQVSVIGEKEPLTLNHLLTAIRAGTDVLYLVCHGALTTEMEPFLFLQNDEGKTDRVPAADFAARIGELQEVPRLIVLASCEGAGKEGDDVTTPGQTAAQAALAPRLAAAGVPAVIAMQGKISMKTIEQMMPKFFTELLTDGQIDRALAVARGTVRDRHDSWMPALFLRMKQGRIWYEPGFAGAGGDQKEEFDKWSSICNQVRKGEFIPILGPELGEDLFGGTRELACALADKHGSPLTKHECEDLAKVTQYLSTSQGRVFAQDEVQRQLHHQLLQRLGAHGDAQTALIKTIDQAVVQTLAKPDDPYRALADLNAAIYLNASPEPLLARALKAAGKEPEAVLGAWRGQEVPKPPAPANVTPTPERPWVYHVFGRLDKPDTLVLTEDDFFDYLIASSKLDLLLPALKRRLVQSSLLFLGFRLNDWRFRVLFRMIVTTEGTGTMKDLSHVGVQINPDENSPADIERARDYLESYFQDGKDDAPKISIYWGSPADFLKELQRRLAAMKAEPFAPVAQGGNDGWD